MKRQTVCLCGSGRFTAAIQSHAHELSLRGYVVLMPHVDASAANTKLDAVEKNRLDLLHLDKITMADEVLVVCPGGYVGESTARELFFARRLGKPVTLTHMTAFITMLSFPDRREFLRQADAFVLQNFRAHADLQVGPTSDELIDSWLVSDHPVTLRNASGQVHAETVALRENLVLTLDLLERAWGVLANAPVAGWAFTEPSEWVGFAEKWRDSYLEILKETHPAMTLTATWRRSRSLLAKTREIVEMVRSRSTMDDDLIRDVQARLKDLAPLVYSWAADTCTSPTES